MRFSAEVSRPTPSYVKLFVCGWVRAYCSKYSRPTPDQLCGGGLGKSTPTPREDTGQLTSKCPDDSWEFEYLIQNVSATSCCNVAIVFDSFCTKAQLLEQENPPMLSDRRRILK